MMKNNECEKLYILEKLDLMFYLPEKTGGFKKTGEY